MITEPLARMAVAAEVMDVVIVLEQAVVLHDPGDLRSHVGPDDGRGKFRMIVGSELVAHVMNQGCHDQLLIRAASHGPRRRLQGMLEAAYRKALQRIVQFHQRTQNGVGQMLRLLALEAVQQLVVLPRALVHAMKTDPLAHAANSGFMNPLTARLHRERAGRGGPRGRHRSTASDLGPGFPAPASRSARAQSAALAASPRSTS